MGPKLNYNVNLDLESKLRMRGWCTSLWRKYKPINIYCDQLEL